MRGHQPERLPGRVQVGSFDELMRLQAAATLDLSGADRSALRSWRVGPRAGIEASYDGVLRCDEQFARDLSAAYANPGSPLDRPTRIRIRTGLKRLLRENLRLGSSDPDDHLVPADVDRHRWARVLDPGIAEAWARDHLDEFVDKLGLDAVVPGIKDVAVVGDYDSEVAAARGLCRAWGAEHEADPALVQQWLNRYDTPGKVGFLVERPTRSHRLAWLVPPHSQHVETLSVQRALLDPLDAVPDADPAAAERQGSRAVTDMIDRLAAIRREYANPGLTDLLETLRHTEAALAISGADHSSYNGYIGDTPAPTRHFVVYGVATFDNGMQLNSQYVVHPLRELYANPGVRHDDDELRAFRKALSTLLHENGHLLAPAGQDNSDARQISDQHWATNAEEAFTNAWTERALDDYIRELGIDEIAPGILDVRHEMTYPRLTAAASELAEGLGRLGADPADALRRVNNETTLFKLETVAGLLYEHSDLPGAGTRARRVARPPADRADAAAALRLARREHGYRRSGRAARVERGPRAAGVRRGSRDGRRARAAVPQPGRPRALPRRDRRPRRRRRGGLRSRSVRHHAPGSRPTPPASERTPHPVTPVDPVLLCVWIA